MCKISFMESRVYKMKSVGVELVLVIAFLNMADACEFPTGLQNNNWTSSGYGNMEFLVSDVKFSDDTNVERTYTCHLNSGSFYVIKSPTVVEFSADVNYYYCFQLQEISSASFSYYIPTVQEIPLNHRKKTLTITTSVTSVDQICDMTAIVAELYVLVLRDNPGSAAVSCATPLLGNFRYTSLPSSTGMMSCGTSPGDGVLGICDSNSTAVIYNYTTCSTVLSYSSSGILYCIATTSTTVDSILTYYQILYNSDPTPTPPTYQFTCMAIAYNSTDNSLVYISETPTICQENMNATTAVTGGNLIFLQANDTCVPVTTTTTTAATTETSSTNTGLIVGLVLAALILLALLAAVLFYCLYWKNRDPNAGKPIVENTKPRFEDPDNEDILEDLELEETRSEPLTRDDIVFTAESPSFIPNGHIGNGHISDKEKTKSVTKDSGVGSSDFSRPSDSQVTPRLNKDRETMVIFNGDEKVISGNDSRVVPSTNQQSFRRFEPDTSGPNNGVLTLQGLEDEYGDGVGELTDHSSRDMPYPTLPREKSNLLPPIETIDPEKDN